MPKLTVSLPSYRHHKPSGRAVVTLNGKDHYLRPRQSEESKEQYNRLIAEWVAARKTTTASVGTGANHCAEGISISELLEGYLAEAEIV